MSSQLAKKTTISLIVLLLLVGMFAGLVWQIHPAQATIAPGLFTDGFESGDLSAWTGTVTAPTVSSTNPHSGTYSVHVAKSAAGSGSYIYAYEILATNHSELWLKSYVYFVSLPVAGDSGTLGALAYSWIGVGAVVLYSTVGRTAGGQLQWGLYNNVASTAYTYSDSSIKNSTWYSVEIHALVNTTSTGVADMWINGTNRIHQTGINLGTSQLGRILIGSEALTGNSTENYQDDVAVANFYIDPVPTFTTPLATSSQVNGTSCVFSELINSSIGLSYGIFSTNNTGPWQNETAVPLSNSSSTWMNVTKPLNSTVGNVASAKWFANDTSGSWSISTILNVTITSSPVVSALGAYGYASVEYSVQRKTFYANGLFWTFFFNGSLNINGSEVYSSSANGVTWSSPVAMSNVKCSAAWEFSVTCNGTVMSYVTSLGSAGSPLYYRAGIPEPTGTITWLDPEQNVTTPEGNIGHLWPSIILDSGGYPWIAYARKNLTENGRYAYITTSSTNNGTWTTASGFPHQLSLINYTGIDVSILPLTGLKVLALVSNIGWQIESYQWNGSAWGPQKNTTSIITTSGGNEVSLSAVNQGDNVALAFIQNSTQNILTTTHFYANDSWGPETIIQSSVTSTSPVLTEDPATNYLYCFWTTSNNIYYKRYNGTAWNFIADSNPWIADTAISGYYGETVSCFYEATNNYIGLIYATDGASSGYRLEFAYLTLGNSVTLNNPLNGAVITNPTVTFSCTPASTEPLQNASLWINITGTWQRVLGNTTALQNAVPTIFTYTFSSVSAQTYVWNVQVYNSTSNWFASANFTLSFPVYQMTFNWTDWNGNPVTTGITWQLNNGSQSFAYSPGAYTLYDGTYVLRTYYGPTLLNTSSLSTAIYGNTTIQVPLNLLPVTSGFIAIDSTITNMTLTSQSPTDLSFVANGTSGPYNITIAVSKQPVYVVKDNITLAYGTDWTYDGVHHTITIFSATLSVWHVLFMAVAPPPQTFILTVVIKNQTMPVSGVNVSAGGLTAITDLSGTSMFTLGNGTYVVSFTYQGSTRNQTILLNSDQQLLFDVSVAPASSLNLYASAIAVTVILAVVAVAILLLRRRK